MKKLLVFSVLILLLTSCTSTDEYRTTYQDSEAEYWSLEGEYQDLEEEYWELEGEYQELEWNYSQLQREMEDYIHRDEVHSNYISEEDFSDFLEAVYDEDGDYIHKDRIEDLVNYYCY